jgi:5-methylcytosine-specific restriction enzyme subunit McrC
MDGSIPVRNIWVLFLYAADLVQFRGRFDSEAERARDLPDLIARLLTRAVEERLQRNLSRGYQPKTATLSRVRGRIDMLKTTTRRLMDRGLVACRFEDHTLDTPRNRLARAALDHLAARIDNNLIAHRCRQLAGDLARLGVSGLRPSRGELASDQIARNETGDRFMVALSRLVFETLIPTEAAGRNTATAPEAGQHLIRRLFERAVGNALRIELASSGWTFRPGQRLSWPITNQSTGLSAILPGMQTDIELNHAASGRRIVIDTKFTAIFTRSVYRDEMLKSGYLYQLYAYLRTQEKDGDPASLCSEGLLLHPQVGGAVDEWMDLQGHRMRFKTIDLAAGPGDFEFQLNNMMGQNQKGHGQDHRDTGRSSITVTGV